MMLWTLCISTSAALLLTLPLLPSCALSLFSLLLLLSTDAAPDSSLAGSGIFLGGADHRFTSHTTPVKLLRVKPPRNHLRQGLPDLSRARRPALMAPWLALGPSLWAPLGRLAEWSIVPSSLPTLSDGPLTPKRATARRCARRPALPSGEKRGAVEATYRRGFFLGPGFPLGLGGPSLLPAAPRLVPLFLGPSVGGPMTDGTGVPSGTGVAAFESVTFSPFELAGAAGPAAELAGDALTSLGSEDDLSDGDSSLTESGSMISRRRRGVMASVTSRLGLLADLRRPSAALVAGGMVAMCECDEARRRRRCRVLRGVAAVEALCRGNEGGQRCEGACGDGGASLVVPGGVVDGGARGRFWAVARQQQRQGGKGCVAEEADEGEEEAVVEVVRSGGGSVAGGAASKQDAKGWSAGGDGRTRRAGLSRLAAVVMQRAHGVGTGQARPGQVRGRPDFWQ